VAIRDVLVVNLEDLMIMFTFSWKILNQLCSPNREGTYKVPEVSPFIGPVVLLTHAETRNLDILVPTEWPSIRAILTLGTDDLLKNALRVQRLLLV